MDKKKIEINLAWNEKETRNKRILPKEILQDAIDNIYTQELLKNNTLYILTEYNTREFPDCILIDLNKVIGTVENIWLDKKSVLISINQDIDIKNKVLGFAYLGSMKGKLFKPNVITYAVLLNKDKSEYIYD